MGFNSGFKGLNPQAYMHLVGKFTQEWR